MSPMSVMPHEKHVWTVFDLEDLPDDGQRYELIDGVLIVSPAPARLHQRAVGELFVLLRQSCPGELETFVAPVDFQPDVRNSVQPDVLVIPRTAPTAKNVTEPPLLTVEVLSPSSRGRDFVLKRSLYEKVGVGSYWIVDPIEPRLWAWDLSDGGYVEVADVVGAQQVELQRPFPVTICPDRLVAG